MRTFALLVLLSLLSDKPMTYVWVHGNRNNIVSSNTDLDRALAVRDELGTNFLWFRLRRAEYVIRDRATLDSIERLWEPYRMSDPEYDRIREGIRTLERQERPIEKEHDRIADREDRADNARLAELRRQLDEIEAKMRVLEKEEDRIDQRRDALEAEIERKMVPILEDAVRTGVAKKR
ncbi:MAG: hypothetical protein JOZ54_17620 [Acidobacteria bacterium]|nr:hypothetical protein [Acidobacteriota bacterium]